jgi:hypothetical protein
MQKIKVECMRCGEAVERAAWNVNRNAVCFTCKKMRNKHYQKTHKQNYYNTMKKKYTITLVNDTDEEYSKTIVALLHKQDDNSYIAESFASGFANDAERELYELEVINDVGTVSEFKYI